MSIAAISIRSVSPNGGRAGLEQDIVKRIQSVIDQTGGDSEFWEEPYFGSFPVVLRKIEDRSVIFSFWDYHRILNSENRDKMMNEDVCAYYVIVTFVQSTNDVIVSGVSVQIPRMLEQSKETLLKIARQQMNGTPTTSFHCDFETLKRENRDLARSILVADLMFKKPIGLVYCPCIDRVTRTNAALVRKETVTAEELVAMGLVKVRHGRKSRATFQGGSFSIFGWYYLRRVENHLELSKEKSIWEENLSHFPVTGRTVESACRPKALIIRSSANSLEGNEASANCDATTKISEHFQDNASEALDSRIWSGALTCHGHVDTVESKFRSNPKRNIYKVATASMDEQEMIVIWDNNSDGSCYKSVIQNSNIRIAISSGRATTVHDLEKYNLNSFKYRHETQADYEEIEVSLKWLEEVCKGRVVAECKDGKCIVGNLRTEANSLTQSSMEQFNGLTGYRGKTLFFWQHRKLLNVRAMSVFITLISIATSLSFSSKSSRVWEVLGAVAQGLGMFFTLITLFAGVVLMPGNNSFADFVLLIVTGKEHLVTLNDLVQRSRLSRQDLIRESLRSPRTCNWMSKQDACAFRGEKNGGLSLGGIDESECNNEGLYFLETRDGLKLFRISGLSLRDVVNYGFSTHAQDEVQYVVDMPAVVLKEHGLATLKGETDI